MSASLCLACCTVERYLPAVVTRRGFLAGAAAVLAAAALRPNFARAIGPGSKFRFGQLQLGSAKAPRPAALKRLAWEIEKRTSIDIDLEPVTVLPTSAELVDTPFLYLAGERDFELPSASGIEALRRFLTFGGFLLIDSAEGQTDGAFDGSVRKLVKAIYPQPAPGLEVISAEHVIYKSFYLLDKPLGRLAIGPAMEGLVREDRIVAAYVSNDMGGAWSRDDFGNYDFPCEPGGERQRELAFRMGINIVMYALCLDYKSDQVHVPTIMKRRRWKPDDGASPPAADAAKLAK
jgi:hypothetical protein